ncbi:hypothetical protein ALI144C_51290 [Actinosynnema sp. ALI-1.44]|uniref:hypothetical protein n=1 Tax=Actinosynnema sp. ALI-1.44 TaxID=1933779 RepID=UPI00097C41E3|nr:hypothetical protein [Actinosynnema sp. ALI-1.44]ONI70960.1 hypothetical protein ALI144C_51290 [Actinosynnema sp. ALI-1.44]
MVLIAGLAACGTEKRTPLVVPAPSYSPSSTSPLKSASSRIVGALPTGCGAIGTPEEISDAVGKQLPGATKFVNGNADASIGRTDRIDCFYGVGNSEQVNDAPVRVGLASYNDANSAATRVQKTIDDEKGAGAKASEVPVGSDKGTLLTARKTVTLVATHQGTTVVVIATTDAVPAAQAATVLSKIADRALSPR